MRLVNEVAVVTGAGRGIGRGIALALAREGAHVVVADIMYENACGVVEEIKALGFQALGIRADVTISADVNEMVSRTLERFGRIDVLVNNAGVISVFRVLDLPEREWDKVLDVNVKGTFLCCKAVIPTMMKQKSGKIINIASQAGRRGRPGLAHYCASKFAVIGFTQSLAKEMAEYGLNVNAVCPGIIYTDMWRILSEEYGKWEGLTPEATFKKIVKEMIPLGRPQTPEDIASLVTFLASKESDNITGQAINVNGGQIMN